MYQVEGIESPNESFIVEVLAIPEGTVNDLEYPEDKDIERHSAALGVESECAS